MEIECSIPNCGFKTSDINELADHIKSHVEIEDTKSTEYKYSAELYTNSKGKVQIIVRAKADTIKQCVKSATQLYLDVGDQAEQDGLELVT